MHCHQVEIGMHKDGTLQYDLINLNPLACMQLRVRVEIGMHKDGRLQYDFLNLFDSFWLAFSSISLHAVLLAWMQLL